MTQVNTVNVAIILGLTTLISPILLAIITARLARADKREDWRRQDEVARLAKEAAVRVEEVAIQAQQAAELLSEQQDRAAEAAAKAAEDLISANDELARITAKSVETVNKKLDQIHTLVNSNLTAAMEDRLTAINALVVALKSMPEKSKEEEQRIESLTSTSIELEAQLIDRKRQTRVADAQVEQSERGGLKAEWDDEEKN